jgi:hypothetical protein
MDWGEVAGQRSGRRAECRETHGVKHPPEKEPRYGVDCHIPQARENVDRGPGPQKTSGPRPIHPDPDEGAQ